MRADVEMVIRFSVEVESQDAADRVAANTLNEEWLAMIHQKLAEGGDVEVEVGEAYDE